VFAVSERDECVDISAPVERSESVDHVAWKPARDDGVSWIEPDPDLAAPRPSSCRPGRSCGRKGSDFFGAARLFFRAAQSDKSSLTVG
jgi:hypothetical protein